jgi:CHAT domain-containing protein
MLRGQRGIAQFSICVCLLTSAATRPAWPQAVSFVAPPRTISDITAILDQQKPDSQLVAKLRSAADENPPLGASEAELAHFYYDRGQARMNLGRSSESIADARRAIEHGKGSVSNIELSVMRQFLGFQLRDLGEVKRSLQVFLEIEHTIEGPGIDARLANTYRHLVSSYIFLGDLSQAEAYVQKSNALIENIRASKDVTEYGRTSAEADVAAASGKLAETRGQFGDAEIFYRHAEKFRRAAVLLHSRTAPPQSQRERAADFLAVSVGRMEARQGRLAEGEADVRRALLNRLKATGKYNLVTARFVGRLSEVLIEQVRLAEAEKLTRTRIEIEHVFQVEKSAQVYADALDQLSTILMLQNRLPEAAQVFAELEAATRDWPPARRDRLVLSPDHVLMLYSQGKIESGIASAERLVERQSAIMGGNHFETGVARGLLAVGLTRDGRDLDALAEFKRAIPILMVASHDIRSGEEDNVGAAMRDQRMRIIAESYMALLARSSSGDAAEESLRAAEFVRAQSVGTALAQASVRMATHEQGLAEMARNEQDLAKQIGALAGVLTNVLALPPDQRDEKAVGALQSQLDDLRARHAAAKRDINLRFPAYANLVEPQPPLLRDIQDALRPNEVFLSFYFGREQSFAWAISKARPVAFIPIGLTAEEIAANVDQLRRALDPDAQTIGDVPPFDLSIAYYLYSQLLKPVEATWRTADTLIVVTNGALGSLPLALLPTSPTVLERNGDGPLFAEYRKVPWLARSHAVTMLPSASALVTLRHLPAGSDGRDKLVGFGDPYFNLAQAMEAAGERYMTDDQMRLVDANTTRGLPLQRRAVPQTETLDHADLGMLPRLPDTAEELQSIARALGVPPAQALHLGKDANEREVETIDLSKFKIVAFATHGLRPGDLDGLTQPALALTAPSVAGIDGDGLLTMGKILALRLDADWVVLSACNSGAGSGTDAEAASGLARAFFYAGSRAILVTNWSVHSASARQLVADLFRRQAVGPQISRAEALRQAMVSMIDGGDYKNDSGTTLFDYAHPLFWAPYTIIGDGG